MMKNKKITLTLFLMITLLSFFPINIEAKLKKTCKYNNSSDDGTTSLSGYSSLEIYIYDDNTADSTITSFMNDSMNNDEPVLNWNSKMTDCPRYAIIGWIDKWGPINEYEVYASGDASYLRNKKSGFDKSTLVEWLDYNAGSKRSEALKYATEQTEKIKKYMQDFDIDNCEDLKWGDGNNLKCQESLETERIQASAAEKQLERYKETKNIKDSDTEYKNFKNTYAEWEKFHEKKLKKLKDQAGKDVKSFINGGKVTNKDDTNYKNFYDVSTKYYKCGNLEKIPKGLPKFTNVIYKLVKVIVPIILIVMGMIDFLKAVLASDEKQMDTNPKNFMRRIGVAVLIYFVMTSVQLLVKVIGGNNQKSISSCFNCFINSEKKCETYDYKF